MDALDDRSKIAQIDKENVLGSVESLPLQCTHAWQQANAITIPKDYSKVQNIVMCGMGGSGLGARVIESVYARALKVPLLRVNGYNLPGFVNQNSLIICSSYSGTTEETVENARQALAKKARTLIICAGGKLLEIAQQNDIPYYKIEPKYNPSNQPRMAIGYSVVGQLALVSKTGLIKISESDVKQLVDIMNNILRKVKVEVNEEQNQAKRLAKKMKNKIIFYVASQHLVGAIHTVNNQLNENAKNLSADPTIPELNHHLMEGLKHPSSNKDSVFFMFASSSLYKDRVKKRFKITQDVVNKNEIDSFTYKATAQDELSQAFELMQFGAYSNFYLCMLYDQNPAPIPWVDYFKTSLGQPLGK